MIFSGLVGRKIGKIKTLGRKHIRNYNNLLGRPIVDSISINSNISSNIVNKCPLFY